MKEHLQKGRIEWDKSQRCWIEVRSALSLQKNVSYEMQFIVISAKQKQGAMLLRLPWSSLCNNSAMEQFQQLNDTPLMLNPTTHHNFIYSNKDAVNSSIHPQRIIQINKYSFH